MIETHVCKHDLEPNFEHESSKERQEAKCQKDANKDIHKMAKPSNFHDKNNTTFENVKSFLKTLEESFSDNYKDAKQVRIATMML